ncbi:MAG: preprotein translocase subunit YajC [Clostridiales bacterium]|nr:preprotein translocase subunit YajC [Clostridiales bacterium]
MNALFSNSSYSMIFSLALVLGAMYIFLILPQKKKDRAEMQMRNSVEAGDEITTIGGIIGKVVSVKDDDTIVIETGSDKVKLKFHKWAIRSRDKSVDDD